MPPEIIIFSAEGSDLAQAADRVEKQYADWSRQFLFVRVNQIHTNLAFAPDNRMWGYTLAVTYTDKAGAPDAP